MPSPCILISIEGIKKHDPECSVSCKGGGIESFFCFLLFVFNPVKTTTGQYIATCMRKIARLDGYFTAIKYVYIDVRACKFECCAFVSVCKV